MRAPHRPPPMTGSHLSDHALMTGAIVTLLSLLGMCGCAAIKKSFTAAPVDISAQCAKLPYLAEVGNTILLMPGIPDARRLCVATQLGDGMICTTVGELRQRLDTRKANP